MKIEIKPLNALQMLDHGPTVLLGVHDEKNSRLNVFAVSWIIPCSHKPPLVTFSCNPKNYSKNLIDKEKEFTVNIPGVPLLDTLHFCGTTTGRKLAKVEKTGLTLKNSTSIKTQCIKDCIAHFECKVVQSIITGDHTLYVAEVLHAMANPEFYEKKWKFQDDAGKTLHYLGGNQYAAIGETFKARTLK